MGELRMSQKERIRLEVLSRVKRGERTVTAACELMGLSLRQSRRVWKRYRELGDSGLAHGLRGRASNRRISEQIRQRIVKRHQDRYADFGPTLACEKLAEEQLGVSPNTLTAILKERGLWERRRRRGRHRRRRERRAHFGSMVQMDGSHHDWFEGRGSRCVLMVWVILGEVLCVQEERTAGADWCVRWRNRWLQVGQEHDHEPWTNLYAGMPRVLR